MEYYVGTLLATEANGRVVNLPSGAQVIRVSELPGKRGGGVRIDFMLPVRSVTEQDIEAYMTQAPDPEPSEPEYTDSTYEAVMAKYKEVVSAEAAEEAK